MTVIEKNIEIAKMLGWFVRQPDKFEGFVSIEAYDNSIYCEGFGHSHNPALKKRFTTSVSGTKMERPVVNWTDVKNLRFHKDYNWMMIAFDFIEAIQNKKKKKLYSVEFANKLVAISSNQHPETRLGKAFYVDTTVGETRKEAWFEGLYRFSAFYNSNKTLQSLKNTTERVLA